jgi:DNA-binding GntR family transcriptional regulator
MQIALRDVAEGTGLSKRSVQDALTRLVKRGLVEVARERMTAVAVYTVRQPWRRGSG